MKPVVYTGTSISYSEAQKMLDADYHPPVRREDIRKLIRTSAPSPEIIGIIDGVFFDSAAVAHREIMEALKSGITVVGGASMGALRAYELEPYGMIGVGRIYEMYKTGTLESDDEVAVTFDGENMGPLSIPLVNIRFTVKALVEKRRLNEELADVIISNARKMFYPDRNYRNILHECASKGIIKKEETIKLLETFKKYEVDVKREDAILVLLKVKELSQLSKGE